MKFILTAVLWLVTTPYFSDANWCTQEITIKLRVTKAQTRVITYRRWYGGTKRKTVSYAITEEVPKITHRRVCCAGFTLNRTRRICEPNCPEGCPQFSECIGQRSCQCQSGYRMKGNCCEPICESGFEYDNSTGSCVENRTTLDLTTDRQGYEESEPISTESASEAIKLEDVTSMREVNLESTEHPQSHSTKSYSLSAKTIRKSSTASTSEATTTEIQGVHLGPTTSSRTLTADEIISTESSVLWSICSFSVQFSPENCPCEEGFVKADSSCHLDYQQQGFKFGECIQESLCRGLTTDNKTPTTTEQVLSSENGELLSITLAEHSTNCDFECSGGGICANGICECPKGSVFSQFSKECIIISCGKICHNGICQENGVCECPEGFFYQHGDGCLPNCDQECINGICIAPGECECNDGFGHEPDNFIECLPHWKLSGKIERRENIEFPWIWVVLTVLAIATLGLLFVIKKYRKHDYDLDKVEQLVVHFDKGLCE